MTVRTPGLARETARRGAGVSLGRWRRRLFRRAGEGDLRRRPRDWIRLGTATTLFVVSARHAGDESATEHALRALLATLPNGVNTLFIATYRLGALWAVALVGVAALVGQRWRLSGVLLVAGLLAWLAARAAGAIVVEHEGIGHGVGVATEVGRSFPTFPSARIAVVVAVISAAHQYVTRPTRLVGHLVVAGVVFSALALGVATPNDAFGGLCLGWGIAALVRLLFGAPGMRPSLPRVVAALSDFGIESTDVRLAERQPAGSTVLVAHDAEGPLRVKVVGRDDADAQWLAKFWRWLLYKDSGPTIPLTRVQQVEHEAYIMFVARQGGVNVPEVVVAGSAGPKAALLVERSVAGIPLSECSPGTVTDEFLAAVWTNVAGLQRARVVHGELDATHVIVCEGEPWFVGFDAARSTGNPTAFSQDIAGMLVATASLVGEERAVDVATAVLGRPKVAAAIPFLQPAALTTQGRAFAGDRRRERREHLGRLRDAAARAAGIEPPELSELRRLDPVSVTMAVGALVAVAALLWDIGDPTTMWATLRTADWSWIAIACALSLAANVPYAIALQGTVQVRLPIVATTELQLGMSFTNLAVPAIGGQGMQVRYLQRMGVDLSSAVAAGGILSSVGSLLGAAVLFALALAIDPAHVDLSLIPAEGLLGAAVVVVVAVAAASCVVFAAPRLRHRLLPPLRVAAQTTREALRSPRHLALLIGGNVLAGVISTLCLLACIAAFGGDAPFWAVLAANMAVVTVASTVPIPGGGTAVGTVGLSIALVSFGVAREVAVAAVLANQLVFYYLPAIPGWFATRHLFRADYL